MLIRQRGAAGEEGDRGEGERDGFQGSGLTFDGVLLHHKRFRIFPGEAAGEISVVVYDVLDDRLIDLGGRLPRQTLKDDGMSLEFFHFFAGEIPNRIV